MTLFKALSTLVLCLSWTSIALSAYDTEVKRIDSSQVRVENLQLQHSGKAFDRFYRIIDNDKGVTCYIISSGSIQSSSSTSSSIQCIKL